MQKDSDIIKFLGLLQKKVDVDTARLIDFMILEATTVKHVCFNGNTQVGKSALINFLLGQKILPEGYGNGATTMCVIHSSYSSTFEIKAKFFDHSELKFYLNETLSNKEESVDSRKYFEKFCRNGYTIEREFTPKDLDSICENFKPLPNEPLMIRDIFDFQQLEVKIRELNEDFRISQIDISAPFENLKQYPNLIFTDLPGISNPIKMISLIAKKWLSNQHGEVIFFLVDETERAFNTDIHKDFCEIKPFYLNLNHNFKKALVVTKANRMFKNENWWKSSDPEKRFENNPILEKRIDFFTAKTKEIVMQNINGKIVFVTDSIKKGRSFECDLMSDFIFSACQSTKQLFSKTNAIIQNFDEEKQSTKKMKHV